MILDEQVPIPPKENENQVTLQGPMDHGSVPIARVIIIDPNAITLSGLSHLLADTDVHVIAEVPSLDKLDDEIVEAKSCMILIGIDESNSALTLSQIAYWTQSHAQLRIVILSNKFNFPEAFDAIRAGASCCLLKSDITRDVLVRSMELSSLGVVVFASELLDALEDHAPVAEIDAQNHRQVFSQQLPQIESETFLQS
ncbi:MAG: response regulator transcription factor [Alphaproteobacteria bacterium]|nr:response regulator transcription factor [Alphaproteobacteria bacterium]